MTRAFKSQKAHSVCAAFIFSLFSSCCNINFVNVFKIQAESKVANLTRSHEMISKLWHFFYYKLLTHSNRYLNNRVSKSIFHLIKNNNFQPHRASPERVIWKNWQLAINFWTNKFDILYIKQCLQNKMFRRKILGRNNKEVSLQICWDSHLSERIIQKSCLLLF